MSWVKMDDRWPSNRKLRRVEPLDRLLWCMAIAYSSDQNTDGHLDNGMVEMVAFLAGVTKPYESADRLVAAGLLDLDVDGYKIHDYLDFQPSAKQRDEISNTKAEAGRKGGQASAQARAQAAATADAQAETKQSSSRPVPSRPVPSQPSSSSSGPNHQAPPEPEPTTDDDRIEQTIEALGTADHIKAIADGVSIRNKQSHREECIRRRRTDRQRAAQIAAEHPDWTPDQIASHIIDPDAALKAERRARTNRALGTN